MSCALSAPRCRRLSTVRPFALIVAAALGAGPPAAAAADEPPRYEVTILGSSEWGLAVGSAINEYGAVAGQWDSGTEFGGPRHAVVWTTDGMMIDLTDSDDVTFAVATGINDAGVVSGWSDGRGEWSITGFRWADGVLDFLPSRFQDRAEHVDPRGFVLGQGHVENFHFEPMIWDEAGRRAELGTLGGISGSARDSNGWGVVVGFSELDPIERRARAFAWRDGTMRDLGTLPGTADSYARGVNVHGEVVGWAGAPLAEQAFLWTEQDGMSRLPALLDGRAVANDINDRGTVVGWARRTDGQIGAGWFDGMVVDLNELVDEPGWRIGTAEGINNGGQITGHGRFENGRTSAVLLTPVDGLDLVAIGPEPGRAGGVNTIDLRGGTPGAIAHVAWGFTLGTAPVPGCPDAIVSIVAPRSVATTLDAAGEASILLTLPAEARGRRLLLQAVEPSTCRTSPLVVRRLD